MHETQFSNRKMQYTFAFFVSMTKTHHFDVVRTDTKNCKHFIICNLQPQNKLIASCLHNLYTKKLLIMLSVADADGVLNPIENALIQTFFPQAKTVMFNFKRAIGG